MQVRQEEQPAPNPPVAAPSEEEEANKAAEAREQARREDELWKEAARAELKILRSYAALVPSRDREYFQFLLGKLSWASELGIDRPDNLEGLFFNQAFFSAGSWGKNPGFRRAWVYLLRAIGIELEPPVEKDVVALLEEVFDNGMEETRAIETEVFGAPLEGGDPEYWEEVGYPPLSDCAIAWESRNDFCMHLYAEFLERVGLLLREDYEHLREFLDLFNLSS